MLHHLTNQEELNRLYGMPQNAELLTDIATAISQETSEVIQELKSYWAWWATGRTPNRELVLEELADVWFFYLTYVLYMQRHQYRFKLDEFEGHFKDLRDTAVRAAGHIGEIDPNESEGTQKLIVRVLNSIKQSVLDAESKPLQTLFTVTSALSYVGALLGFTGADIEHAYVNKFLKDVHRTGKSQEPSAQTLISRMQDIALNLPSPEFKRMNA